MVRKGISPTLGIFVTEYPERGYLETADGIRYTKDEVLALRGSHPELIAAVHRAKRILQGTVVEVRDIPAHAFERRLEGRSA